MILHRISREQAFMQTAEVWSQRSTCARRNVGAVIVVNDRIVSTGYNGAPPGHDHCDGKTCVPPGRLGCTRTIHAEANALERIPKEFAHMPKQMFVTESPCQACAAKMMGSLGFNFTSVYYTNEYRLVVGIKLLILHGIAVYRMTPSGYVLRKTIDNAGELMEEWT